MLLWSATVPGVTVLFPRQGTFLCILYIGAIPGIWVDSQDTLNFMFLQFFKHLNSSYSHVLLICGLLGACWKWQALVMEVVDCASQKENMHF